MTELVEDKFIRQTIITIPFLSNTVLYRFIDAELIYL